MADESATDPTIQADEASDANGPATQQLAALIHRDIETGHKPYAEEYGCDWDNLSEAEAEVFDLSLDEMPSLVAVWCAYEGVLTICDLLGMPKGLAEAVRAEHPFMAALCHDPNEPPEISLEWFQAFATLFNVPYRSSHAWFAKVWFHRLRTEGVTYKDEHPEEPTPSDTEDGDLDDELPF